MKKKFLIPALLLSIAVGCFSTDEKKDSQLNTAVLFTVTTSGFSTNMGDTIPGTYNFGSVAVGQNKTVNFSLTNIGQTPQNITAINLNNSDFSIVTSYTGDIAPGESKPLSIKFAPFGPNVSNSNVEIIGTNFGVGVVYFKITGTGTSATTTITPEPITPPAWLYGTGSATWSVSNYSWTFTADNAVNATNGLTVLDVKSYNANQASNGTAPSQLAYFDSETIIGSVYIIEFKQNGVANSAYSFTFTKVSSTQITCVNGTSNVTLTKQ